LGFLGGQLSRGIVFGSISTIDDKLSVLENVVEPSSGRGINPQIDLSLGVSGKIRLGVAWTKTVSIGCKKQGPGGQLKAQLEPVLDLKKAGLSLFGR